MTPPPTTPNASTAPPAGTSVPAPVNTAALRLARTPMDMAKAVLVLLVPVMVAVLIYVFFFNGSNVIAIDPSGTYAEAGSTAHFTVLAPANLPDGWKAVSSSYQAVAGDSVLRVGYIAPGGGGIQLVETDQPADAFIAQELGGTQAVATSVQLGDRSWGEVRPGAHVSHALVDTEAGRTVIVMGQATDAELRAFASALH